MANYNDYVKTDELQEEIETAAVEADNREGSLPERFQGKSAEEIANSYLELEKMNSRQSQDLGAMRQTVDELVRQSETANQESDTSAEESVTVDDLYDNPEAAIERVLDRKLKSQADAQPVDLSQDPAFMAGKADLDSKYEGWAELVQTPEFQNWVHEKPYRSNMAKAADGYDFSAANDLLAQYHDTHGDGGAAQRAARQKALSDAGLESGGAEYDEPAEKFSRTELMKLRVRAKRGDYEAADYLKANGDAIAIAYEEGRIVD